ncbi:acyltransferase-domain-containing protein [Alternaria alternata]|uniref:Acyltransferase-domain-containing protein n=1 Tax=Alternaria alternata TaxID=5599 RepID=A0A177DC72_ALTAL|nr:acyltransferase-domain-containing protein [Alternaria alternata]OAG16439.1 acyltransferase-domain-containing protein [Alternaria alternata]
MSPANVTKKPVVTKSPAAKPPVKKATAPKPTPTSQSASKRPVPAAVQRKKKDDLGAGLRISKENVEAHPAGPPRFGELTQAERAFTLASTFLSGVLAISASQFLGAPLKLIDPQFYDGYMAYTKECFAILITCLTQWWAPTVVRVSGDSSMVGQLIKRKDGSLQCNFADRLVLMANHQLYTDWLYLWWIAYTNNMHGFIYIILKESLKNIPIIGWGAQFYNFIFLSRKWEEDQRTFKKHLTKLNKKGDPMWLIIFPEGTNLSKTTREKSQKWAQKNGLQDMKHQLLPRSTGLKFCLNELRETTDWLYDCTIAYEGVPEGQFGQDIFTLRSSFFEGRPPKSVNMHWRRFHLDDIPYENTHAFEVWLRNRWREKDYMLEYFSRHTRFPAEDFWKNHLDMDTKSESSRGNGSKTIRTVPRPAVQIETEVKSGNWNEFVKIFAPITSVMMALTVAYGASPADLPIPGGKEFFENHIKTLLGQGGEMKGLPSPEQLEKMIEGAAQMGAAQAAGPKEVPEVQRLTQENLAKLVKETAIASGAVMPNGMRRASTAIPGAPTKTLETPTATTPAARRAQSAINLPTSSAKKPTTAAAPKPGTAAHARINSTSAATKKPAPTPTGPMKEMMTASGVMIKVPQTEVEQAKKTGTLTMKNGVKIKVGKDEIEKAQEKKGTTFMTAGGVPIKVTPSGAVQVPQKVDKGQAVKKTGELAKKMDAISTPAKKAPSKIASGTNGTVKKTPAANGTAKKPVAAPRKL